MKKLMLVFLVAVSPVFAESGPSVVFSCHTPNIVDGGYVVKVEEGNAPGVAQVVVGNDSIEGFRPLKTFSVQSGEVEGQYYYRGENIDLVIGPSHEGSHNGMFTAIIDGQTHDSNLTCFSPNIG